MKDTDWAWLQNHDELRYRTAKAMRTYLNHLEGAVREAKERDGAYGSYTTILKTDEDILLSRLQLLGS